MTAGLRRAWRAVRLRTRLALGLGALALAVFAIVGAAMVTHMEDFLERQLDQQMRVSQFAQAKDVAQRGALTGGPYNWFTAVYDVKDGSAVPRDASDLPADGRARAALDAVAMDSAGSPSGVYRTLHLEGSGDYRVRGCASDSGAVLVSAAPMTEIHSTVRQLVTVGTVVFAIALLILVVLGQRLIRRGLRPLSEMARTARDITSRDLTDSARLPVRAQGGSGGPEAEELRTAFNTMLAHIDNAFAARAEAEQRLRRFVADASHELRTPLMSIRGYADLFQYAAANAPRERELHLARLRSEAARMSVLVDDLLLLARLDAAEEDAPLHKEPVDLEELVQQAADAFRAGHPDHPLTVQAGPGPVRGQLDPLRIRQVLDNLLTNAAVHTPAGTAVFVALSVDGDAAVVRVGDAGPGIPADEQQRVFDRFYRIDTARSRERGGSGLGLAVARSLVAAHGGTIDVTSRAGSTVFTMTIPLTRADPEPA
ncbi:ATP-binding protein [Streptomyces sp. KLOTTS4A1]|uniref:sensor histidine kinase n=1 Tax=Streptomyces sp. KLOTTS4A1 TaxID=3390996 RepID=UPI0039F5E826